ncbi:MULTISPECIES: hypothetical protein [Deinococcus]|jgi:hypothetical protein|uniref:Uncharacterized protein n=2 Tax=Deinococcus TaxID=1298 RepID=A0A221T1L9_9DEIO|nr:MULTISPECIES: hypothetical protein [Deinococcus]ASN82784.1 hypothetical protein DFI_15605 [Deinococcus ficus]MDP9766177.1 hypothetical protein [Deinococcus enclensis]
MEQDDNRPVPDEGRVYVLRVWHDTREDEASWHATVREGSHGARRSFASVDACIEHLYGELLRRPPR